jgi:hypothetical protein
MDITAHFVPVLSHYLIGLMARDEAIGHQVGQNSFEIQFSVAMVLWFGLVQEPSFRIRVEVVLSYL